jgi:hypothetical protein
VFRARTFFSRPYDSDRCRKPFATFLTLLLASDTVPKPAIAVSFAKFLDRQDQYHREA